MTNLQKSLNQKSFSIKINDKQTVENWIAFKKKIFKEKGVKLNNLQLLTLLVKNYYEKNN